MIMCELCRKESASVKVIYGSYQSHYVQILKLCLQCNNKLWDGDKIHSLKKLVSTGIIYYSIKELK